MTRTLEHDLRLGDRGRRRDPGLLAELFRAGCRYAGQAPTVQKLRTDVQRAPGAASDALIRQYLSFLDGALLLRQIRALEARGHTPKAAARLMVSDLGVRRAVLAERVPLHPVEQGAEPVAAGHLAENVLAIALMAMSAGELTWSPERRRRPEVDLVLTVGGTRVPIEVKFRRKVQAADLDGLHAFLDAGLHAPFGVLITRDDAVELPPLGDRVVALPLASALLLA